MRITRDADFDIDGDQVLHDLSQAVEEGLKALRHREAVRLEIDKGADPDLMEAIRRPLKLQPQEIYPIDGPLDLSAFLEWHGLDGFAHLRDEPFNSRRPFSLEDGADIFRIVRHARRVRAPSLRVVQLRGRLPPAGGRRPRCPRHQADAVPRR